VITWSRDHVITWSLPMESTSNALNNHVKN
jgi:hypothetical protein